MPTDTSNVAAVLRAAPRALAEYTLVRHGELDPDLFARYGADGRAIWRGDVESRLANLAAALEVGRPELFDDFVRWQRRGLATRGVDCGDLRRSLECMREVLGSELPAGTAGVALSAIDAALADLALPLAASDEGLAADAPHRDLARRFLVALLEWRGEDAESLVLDAVADGLALADLYTHVFVPIGVEVGQLWQAGELSIAEEHYVTGAIQELMARLTRAGAPATRTGLTAVVCAVGGDAHDMAVRMVADALRWSGWSVCSLGAGAPPEDVVQAAADAGADLVALSATLVSHVAVARATVRALRADERTRGTRVLVGGRPFDVAPDLWRDIGADGWAPDLPGAVACAERLARVG